MADFRLPRSFQLSQVFGLTVGKTMGIGPLIVVLPFRPLARGSKIDQFSHSAPRYEPETCCPVPILLLCIAANVHRRQLRRHIDGNSSLKICAGDSARLRPLAWLQLPQSFNTRLVDRNRSLSDCYRIPPEKSGIIIAVARHCRMYI